MSSTGEFYAEWRVLLTLTGRLKPVKVKVTTTQEEDMTISIANYDLLFPMDVDKKRIHLAVMNRERLIRRLTLPYDPKNLLDYVRNSFAGQRGVFVYEAGPTGYGLYDFLTEQGEHCEVAVPSMIPKAPGQRVKTNRLDAYNLGVQMRTGDLNLVHVPENKFRDLRHLCRLRLQYSKRIVGTKNGLKSIYLFEGIEFPSGKWSRKVISELQQIKHRSAVEFKVNQLLINLEFFRIQELKAKAEIRSFCRKDGELNRCIVHLMSLPGVGWTVSTYILGALGGFKHLISVKKTSGFLGLGPREHSTGDKVRRGAITAVGDPNGRKMIIQASWVGIKNDPELRAAYEKVISRNPQRIAKQKAIIAVARKMVCRIHAVLRDQRPFENRLKKVA
jgi:transposase